ncbi:hypothetical protein OF829_00425 [Sphingomonas sp. LB-2]|uniref:hypothetical protein n=1 Tax=Sphingomonas caeni TaxID=2984949 RepID=UPI002230436E|nr:hypothetical protein [Sphingomonas caeni]MCW3845686.1 hypothetical protein [Sphingomonas caeni]
MQKIMFIRHGEKPETGIDGVTPAGKKDKEDLIVQGWQRAGALARFFAPLAPNTIAAGLEVPTTLFAAAVNAASKSIRPQHTITPLSQLTGIAIDINYGDGDEAALAAAAVAASANGPVLVAWQHQQIPCLISNVAGTPLAPEWPGDRFDLVWVLDLIDGAWTFSQVPQMLIAGDSTAPAPVLTTPCVAKLKKLKKPKGG